MENKGISGAVIKAAADITMLIDHLGASVVVAVYYAAAKAQRTQILQNYHLMRNIGRIAFPLFIFLLIEGFFYTKSRAKYLLRLSIFSLLSEIPFDLAIVLKKAEVQSGTILEFTSQNVFFTLAIGLACIWICDLVLEAGTGHEKGTAHILEFPEWKDLRGWAVLLGKGLICAAVAFAAMAAAAALKTDYGRWGIAAICAAYAMKKIGLTWLVHPAAVAVLCLLASSEAYALFGWPLTLFYRGERGRQLPRYFYYAYYPGHLLILGLLKIFVFSK
ncbi:MAG: conjugal transfer protein TraX [Lachnospiraceae bacterium]|nr:conjugal transfer protein TraX [Lachnospiraceae bacterium]